MKIKRLALICIALLALLLGSRPPTLAQADDDLDVRIETLLSQLSVEERVGQLFLVSFVGQTAYPEDAISQLILEYKIGGVVLMEINNNVDNTLDDTPAQVANLSNQLQMRAYQATHHEGDDDFFLPMFVSIDHEGDGFPHARLRQGFTPIPSTMALGATWNPDDVEAVGAVIGQELAAVGLNMLLGPVVDVLENPRPEGSGDINIRAFGGSPFWVGQMGRAYVRGVHQGSDGRVLTVAKHFPGHGASDRLPDDEVATVNKSLAELQESDLRPFFAVTSPDPDDPLGVTDGMMPSHIRYRGFQGDVSQLTRPISLDPEGMAAFMALSPLAEWRQTGLIVCDSLGVPAVKGYYDPSFETFPARQIAKDALMAGNDLLPLVNFSPIDAPGWFNGQRPTIEDTVTFFHKEYRDNELFRQRVDDAVRHILRAKLRLYPELQLEQVLVSGDAPTGQGGAVVAEVARQSLTLLHPRPEDLARRLPAPPRSDEQILIMGCFEDCLPFVRLPSQTVRDTLLDLYGPQGSDLIAPEQVQLLDFMALYQFMSQQLEDAPDTAQAIVEGVRDADWIVILLINYMPDTQPQSGAARLFLRDPNFDLRDKKVVALALHAPYYLDATEIGKLSAYYAVYSKVEPALQVAWRALFQEITPRGASPVSVEGIGYDLKAALSPDPEQTLALYLEAHDGDVWRVGDAVHVRAGPLLDHNGHPVPDGTRVLFQGSYADLDISLSPRQLTDTVQGVAWAVFQPSLAGRLEITARAGAVAAEPLSLLVAAEVVATPTPSSPGTDGDTPPGTDGDTPPGTDGDTPSPTAPPPTPSPTTTAPAVTARPAVQAVTKTPTDEIVPPETEGDGLPVPLLIALGGLLTLGALAYLWTHNRPAPGATGTPGAGAAAAPDESATSTVSVELMTPPAQLTGRTLGSCRVEKKLGEGGMGQVYKGYHPLLDRPVAIKVLSPDLLASDEMRARFLQEARIAAALRHPNIVQIYDFGEADDLRYMILEYVDGASLKGRLAELRAAGEVMPLDEAIEIARQVAEALAYAHAHGAVHRDLKPANVLLDAQGQAILADFGLAVLRGAPRYTAPGKVWGSPSYIAPEQLGEPPQMDGRSDIYALGVVLYEMLTGRPPFQADAVMEVLWQQVNTAPRAPRELAPDLPVNLEAIILKALAKDPAERYQTARALADDLQDALHATFAPPQSPPVGGKPGPPPTGRD